MPTPPLFYVDDPSVWIVQRAGSSGLSLCLGEVNSAMKFDSAWAFMAVLGRYFMSNCLSLMAYCIIHPVASGLFIAFLMG